MSRSNARSRGRVPAPWAGSDLLFPMPSVLYGIAKVFDLSGQFDLFNTSRSPAEADSLAFASDYRAVTSDLAMARLALLRADPELQAAIAAMIARKQPSNGRSTLRKLKADQSEHEREAQEPKPA